MKTLIICGPPRTGTTGLFDLINLSNEAFVSNELATFHFAPLWNKNIKNLGPKNIEALQRKNWDANQLSEMIRSKEYPSVLKIFGDKFPDYCLHQIVAEQLVNTYGESAYFIFTTRKMCGIINSFFKRFKIEKDPKAVWFTDDVETALKRIKKYYDNMIYMYPKIKNKIIINYEDAMMNSNYIHYKLKSFLDLDVPIDIINKNYKNNKFDEWKTSLNDYQKNIINEFINKFRNEYKDFNEIIPY